LEGATVELSVLVQPTANNRFRAWCTAPVAAEAEGATRDEALANLKTDIEAKTRGAELVRIAFPTAAGDPPGTFGDEQSDTPDAVAAWVAAFDAIPPLQMTATEEADWKAERRARAARDAGAVDQLASELRGAGE
jgi:hypothetical protein